MAIKGRQDGFVCRSALAPLFGAIVTMQNDQPVFADNGWDAAEALIAAHDNENIRHDLLYQEPGPVDDAVALDAGRPCN